MSSLKVGQPLSDEELGEIERSLFGKLRAHRLSDSFIERWGEEAVQKGLVEYLRALDRGVEVENREAFVVQAAFLRAIDEVRREARLADGTEIEAFFDAGVLAEPATEELAVDHLAAGELHTAIESLPPEQRQALRLHYFDGLSAEEGAKALYCSERTYRRRLAKALRGLSRRLGAPVPEPGSGLAIEIGLAAWVSLRGADVALARGLVSPLSGALARGREGMAWLLDRLREPAARLGDGSGERLASIASGPAKVVGGCVGAAAVCAIGGVVVTGVGGGTSSPTHHLSRRAPHARHAATKPQLVEPVADTPVSEAPPPSGAGGSTSTGGKPQPSRAARRRQARKAEERQVEEQMSAMSRAASEASPEPSSTAESSDTSEGEAVTVTPSGGGSSSSSASEEEQVERQFGAFK